VHTHGTEGVGRRGAAGGQRLIDVAFVTS